MIETLKALILPNHPVKCPILFGPLRGSRPLMNPRTSLRYILGIYESQLNGWLRKAIPQTNSLLDVGANHGYFSFGVMAAWRRARKNGRVWAFEPHQEAAQLLRTAAAWHAGDGIEIEVEERFVGDLEDKSTLVLDHYLLSKDIKAESLKALIKIDVEGAEMKVLEGAKSLVRNGNLFVVEAHSAELLSEVCRFFDIHGHAHDVVYQKELPIAGRSICSPDNWWVVSKL